jgi:hypothetical protein
MQIAIEVTRRYPGRPEDLAARFTRFQGMSAWHPLVLESRGVGEQPGARRTLVAGEAEVEEELVGRDSHRIDYTIVRSPHPIRGYRAFIEAVPDGDGARVRWGSTCRTADADADAVREGFRAFYEAGLRGLEVSDG